MQPWTRAERDPKPGALSDVPACVCLLVCTWFRFTVGLKGEVVERGAFDATAPRGMAAGRVLGAVAVRPRFEVPVQVVGEAADPLEPRRWRCARAVVIEHVRALRQPIVGADPTGAGRPEQADRSRPAGALPAH